ncbi:hypothetical protein MA16_Dca024068 [Dendrobium catenatum]|uniref:Uncharacterized protein n=1 Tax=Dendrobium catenatum TaxID=906689 RepID=A0A2I0V8D5_9ASPA|nr:hypothetical protein MA16_Dca024068 [Dendrobium catenatum]
MLRRLLADICNDKMVVWLLVFQLLFEDQVLLVKDLKDLKFFGFSFVNVKRVVMIISLVVFGNDEARYWFLEVVVSVMDLHWNTTSVVLASMMGVVVIFSLYDFACEEANSWTIEEVVGVIVLSSLIGSFLVDVVGCIDATLQNSTLNWSLLDPKIDGVLVDVWIAGLVVIFVFLETCYHFLVLLLGFLYLFKTIMMKYGIFTMFHFHLLGKLGY